MQQCVKKVAVFVEHFPPFLGSDRTIYELMKRVADYGVTVRFIATHPLRHLLGKRPANWSYLENWKHPPTNIHRNFSVTYLIAPRRLSGLWKRIPALAYILTTIYFIGCAIRELARIKPDIVISAHASPILGVVSVVASKVGLRKLVMGCPDWISAYAAGLANEKMSSLGPVFLQLVEMQLYKWSDRVVVATAFLRTLLTQYGISPAKIVQIPNGVDPSVFTPTQRVDDIRRKYHLENRCVVLFSGHLEEWAGIAVIVDLARRLSREAPDSVILLVGAGDVVKQIFGSLVSENLGQMLVHAGLQPYDEMPRFTAIADVALCIFPNTPVAHAASPLKLLEYMSCGRAVVATKVAGTYEILKEGGGILVQPQNHDEICSAVLELCMDSVKRKDLGARARELVIEKYAWSTLAQDFLEMCEVMCRRE